MSFSNKGEIKKKTQTYYSKERRAMKWSKKGKKWKKKNPAIFKSPIFTNSVQGSF